MNPVIVLVLSALKILPDDALALYQELKAKYPQLGDALDEFVAWGIEAARQALGDAFPDEEAVKNILKGVFLELASKRPGYDPDGNFGA